MWRSWTSDPNKRLHNYKAMEKSEQEDFFKESKEELQQYLQDRIWLLKLQAGEKGSRIFATIITVLVIGLFGFFVLLFLSIMAGYYFAELTQSLFTGFSIIAGFYILVLALLIFYRKKIMAKLADTVIAHLFDQNGTPDNGKA